LEYADEADYEDSDGANLLQYDGDVGDERPEFVRLETGVSLEILKEGSLIRIIVRVCK
jgi:hypothetical protein